MELVMLTVQMLDEHYIKNRKRFRKDSKYPSTMMKKYATKVENYRRVFDMEEIERMFHLRCKGCDLVFVPGVKVYEIDVYINPVYCHVGCIGRIAERNPHLAKRIT